MPIYSGFTQKRRRVKLLTAGEDAYYLTNEVGGTIEMEAVINDSTNLRNHTLEWVQASGADVELSSYNTLQTSYEMSEASDKVFQFYLDRGTNREQLKETSIYYTPTSRLTGHNATQSRIRHVEQTIPNLDWRDGVSIPEPSGEINPDVDVLNGYGFEFDQTSVSGLVGNAIRLNIWGAVGEYTHTPNNLMDSYEISDGVVPDFHMYPNGSYVVEIVYDLGIEKSFLSPAIFATESEDSGGVHAVDDIVEPAEFSSIGRVTNVLRYVTSLMSNSSSHQVDFSATQTRVSSVVRYTPTKMNVSNTVSETTTSMCASAMRLSNVTRTNLSQIGSS